VDTCSIWTRILFHPAAVLPLSYLPLTDIQHWPKVCMNTVLSFWAPVCKPRVKVCRIIASAARMDCAARRCHYLPRPLRLRSHSWHRPPIY
jgi:hypothetical protein